ncbi:hypothetical protein ACPPVQ_18840 [Diaminobutyricibacter sp. McL0618]|uniref:hypothetical protein n=1 Tax=Leifsonia sp. McL0618 TaxID=3415677 RepID=UPI003CEBF730
MRHIDTAPGAAALAEEILGERSKPLILISTTNDGALQFDLELIAREVADDADVVTIATGEATYALENALPAKSHVFAGAARSYPVDFGANADWRRSILRFPDRHSADELIEDALAQVTVSTRPATATRRAWVRATVERVSGASGNVAKLENGERVMVVADNLPAHLSLADALVEGGPVEGWLTERDLAPEADEVDLARFKDGSVTLARVVKVTLQRAYLALHPAALEITLRRRDLIPDVDAGENVEVQVADVVRAGQTVRARITRSGVAIGLSLIDVDTETTLVPSLPLLRGGLPWLREGVHAKEPTPAQDLPTLSDGHVTGILHESTHSVAADQTQAAPASPASEPIMSATALAELRDEISELRGAFGRLGRELRAGTDLETLDRLRDESTVLSAELHRERALRRERDITISGLRQELREARASRREESASARTARDAWTSDEEWLRFEVFTTWADRTIASEKSLHPLRDYAIGAKFMQSLSSLDAGQLEKALRTIVDVATRRVAEIPARQLHRLREGEGGSDPYVTRSDGATCWRASLEANAPSARRLHYWQLPGGRIELSRVVLHDDVEP